MRQTLYILLAVVGLAVSTDTAAAQYRYEVRQNPFTGRVQAGVTVRNPFTGTVGTRTSSYNPWTGRTATNVSRYNPYTGAGYRKGAAYNPLTGRYGYYGYGRRW